MRINSIVVMVLLGVESVAAVPSSEELKANANALLVQAQKVAVFVPNVDREPYHERVSFLFSGLVQGDQRGTFVYDFRSKELWRWKWELPGYQEINVRNGKQVGERETNEFEPVRISQLRWALPPFYVILGENDVPKKIAPEKVNGQDAQCIQFEAVRSRDHFDRQVCLDVGNHTMLRWSDERREIEWTDYVPFKDRFYPQHVTVKEHGNKIIQAEIEFQAASDLSPSAFEIPSDMRTRKACEHLTRPIVIKRVEPEYPKRIGVRSLDADVVIEVKVSVEGKVDEAQITETGGSDLDRAALDAVKKWVFEPAKCDGEPVSNKVTVAVDFRN